MFQDIDIGRVCHVIPMIPMILIPNFGGTRQISCENLEMSGDVSSFSSKGADCSAATWESRRFCLDSAAEYFENRFVKEWKTDESWWKLMKTDELWWANMNNMNHNFPKHGRTKNLDSEVVSVHGRDLCGKCNSLCCSKCHVCSLEFYGAVWSCMEPWHSHLIHLDPSLIIFIAGWMWWWHPTSWKQWLPGGSTCQRLNAMLQQVLQRFKGQDFVCWSLEFIVTYSDHWPRRKGLEDLRALYPEVIQEVLQCRVPFPLMRGELTWSNMAGGFKLFQIISYNLQHSANILWHLWPKNSFRHDTWLDMTWPVLGQLVGLWKKRAVPRCVDLVWWLAWNFTRLDLWIPLGRTAAWRHGGTVRFQWGN